MLTFSTTMCNKNITRVVVFFLIIRLPLLPHMKKALTATKCLCIIYCGLSVSVVWGNGSLMCENFALRSKLKPDFLSKLKRANVH